MGGALAKGVDFGDDLASVVVEPVAGDGLFSCGAGVVGERGAGDLVEGVEDECGDNACGIGDACGFAVLEVGDAAADEV